MSGEGKGGGAPAVRLGWLDGVKGLSILWIAVFHFFGAWQNGRLPSALGEGFLTKYLAACAPESALDTAVCVVRAAGVAVLQVGFHAVGVFLVLSGFGLAYSLAKTGDPAGGWLGWYRSRLLRLFPMYWTAHLLYVVSPFQSRPEPIDERFFHSLLGNRMWPVETMPFYFNPALWYFGLLLQLYVVFPLLFRALERLGPGAFLAAAALATFGCRYVLLCVYPVHGQWVQGSLFAGRLWEFALGMAMGLLWRRQPEAMNRLLFSPLTLLAGAVLYVVGIDSYGALWSYTFTDALLGTGLTIVLAHLARGLEPLPLLGAALVAVGTYSYGLYLIHQPYVLWFGARMRWMAAPEFLAAAVAILVVLTLAGMTLERGVNGLTNRVLRA